MIKYLIKTNLHVISSSRCRSRDDNELIMIYVQDGQRKIDNLIDDSSIFCKLNLNI